jgi:2-polyprenyl-6-hydroxyphenyl methylase/3-demethylubiquinone-9 3-methyltransferase
MTRTESIMALQSQTVDKDEIERFSRIADEWWDEHGKFRPLHQINPLRLQYIRDRVCAHYGRKSEQREALSGLTLLDIGCGGGLLCEPMTRLGAHVTGIDASDKNIKVASLHAERMGLSIDYQCTTPEMLVPSASCLVPDDLQSTRHKALNTSFDIVLALEIVEHVADVPAFLHAVAALVKPGGILFMSTLNRTAKSYALGILGAEYVLRWLPRGTHTWKKFLKPSELCGALRKENMHIDHMTGMTFNPFGGSWSLNDNDLGVNYLLTATKPT